MRPHRRRRPTEAGAVAVVVVAALTASAGGRILPSSFLASHDRTPPPPPPRRIIGVASALSSSSSFPPPTRRSAAATPPPPPPESRPRRRRVVAVVGAGVGGLATAARVAAAASSSSSTMTHSPIGGPPPCEVIVLEKNPDDMIGGRCGSFDVTLSGGGGGGGGGPSAGPGGVFRHERGPSLLLLREAYEEVFRDCSPSGKSAEEYGLEMIPCVPAYRVVFDDGDSIDLGFPADARSGDGDSESNSAATMMMMTMREAERRSRSKMDTYETDGALRWDEYMRSTSAFLDCGLPNFIEERLDLPSFPSFLVEALRDGARSWPLRPHSDVLDATFSSDKMRALASFQDLYVGLEPYGRPDKIGGGVLRRTAPAVFGLLAALELHPTNERAGVFAPVGGFRAVGAAFRGLAEDCGVKFRFESTVTGVTEDGVYYKTKGEEGGEDDTKTEFLKADVVVINADLPFATETLLESESTSSSSPRRSAGEKDDSPPSTTTAYAPPEERYDWDDSFDYSSGVIAFHWSMSSALDALNTHNVFLSASSREDAERSWEAVRCSSSSSVGDGDASTPPPSPSSDRPFNFYVHRASATDPTAAPEGCDSIMVLVPCGTLRRNEEWANLPRGDAIRRYAGQFDERFVDATREAVLGRMAALDGLEDLRECIEDEVVDTPATYAEYYNLAAGTPFALSHGFSQLSLTRPGAQVRTVDNALFVGASSRPGNGVPLVLLGAKSVAEKVLRKLAADGDKKKKKKKKKES